MVADVRRLLVDSREVGVIYAYMAKKYNLSERMARTYVSKIREENKKSFSEEELKHLAWQLLSQKLRMLSSILLDDKQLPKKNLSTRESLLVLKIHESIEKNILSNMSDGNETDVTINIE